MSNGKPNVIYLKRSKVRDAIDELDALKARAWVAVAIIDNGPDKDETIRVYGPEGFDFITMLGMIEYSKSQMEQKP